MTKQTKNPLAAALRSALSHVCDPNEDADGALAALDALPLAASAELRTVYAALAGCSIEPDEGQMIDVFTLHELADVHRQAVYRAALPGALFFASDGSDGWYYVDTDGAIGGTAGAVLWGDRGSMSRATSRRIAGDLAGFLRAASDGKLYPNVEMPTIAG